MAHSWPSRRASSSGSATSPGVGVAPPCPQPAEHGEGRDAAGRHRHSLGGQAGHRRARLGPASLFEVAAGQPGAGVAPAGVQVTFGGPCDGVAQPPVGQGVAPDLPGARAEVGHGDGRQLVVPVLLGGLEAPSQGERRLVGVREPLGGTDRVERPGELLVLAEAFGEHDGAPARFDRVRDLPGEHPHVGQVGVGGGVRRPRRRGLRHGHRRGGGLERLGRPVGVPALGGVPRQQLGQPPVLQPAGEAQGRGVEVDRLPVGAEGGGAGSTPLGTTAAASSAPRATGESRPARASTASRTVGGTSRLEVPSTSVTKNGLPPVIRWRRSGRSPGGGPAWPRPPWSAPGARGGAPSARSPGRR